MAKTPPPLTYRQELAAAVSRARSAVADAAADAVALEPAADSDASAAWALYTDALEDYRRAANALERYLSHPAFGPDGARLVPVTIGAQPE